MSSKTLATASSALETLLARRRGDKPSSSITKYTASRRRKSKSQSATQATSKIDEADLDENTRARIAKEKQQRVDAAVALLKRNAKVSEEGKRVRERILKRRAEKSEKGRRRKKRKSEPVGFGDIAEEDD